MHIVINNFYYKTENKDFAIYLDSLFRYSKISLRMYNDNHHHTGSIFRGTISNIDTDRYNQMHENYYMPGPYGNGDGSQDNQWGNQAKLINNESDMITLLCDIVTKFNGSIDL